LWCSFEGIGYAREKISNEKGEGRDELGWGKVGELG